MKQFGVSDKHTGPWLGESDKPDQALAKGRAMWGEKTMLYIAVLDVMNPADGLPSIEVLIGDVREALVEKYGSGADAIFDDKKVQAALADWWEQVKQFGLATIIGEVAAVDHMVASQIKVYSPGNEVKLADFK